METVKDNKLVAGMIIMGAILVSLAYLGRDCPAPTQPEEVEEYYYDTEEYKIKPQVTNGIMVLDIDDLTFAEAFKVMRAWKGSNDKFIWHGATYTTMLESEMPLNWVLAGDDIDDDFYCPDNYVDECGVCGGQGVRSWYVDNDGDGIGDPNTLVRTCEKPL